MPQRYATRDDILMLMPLLPFHAMLLRDAFRPPPTLRHFDAATRFDAAAVMRAMMSAPRAHAKSAARCAMLIVTAL